MRWYKMAIDHNAPVYNEQILDVARHALEGLNPTEKDINSLYHHLVKWLEWYEAQERHNSPGQMVPEAGPIKA